MNTFFLLSTKTKKKKKTYILCAFPKNETVLLRACWVLESEFVSFTLVGSRQAEGGCSCHSLTEDREQKEFLVSP